MDGSAGAAGNTPSVSRDNVERVKAIAPADGVDLVQVFAAGELPPSDLFAPDTKVLFTAGDAEMQKQGAQGFYEGWRDWLEPWERYHVHHEGFEDRGDSVMMKVRLRGVTKHGGVELEEHAVAVFRFEGDQVVELRFTLGDG